MKYVLKTKRDLEILRLCNGLSKLKLSKSDKKLASLIKTQLEKDWRKHLLIELRKLARKYQK